MAGQASRYELLMKLASGGMATVYVGRVRGPLGFSRLVAIKRAHPHLLEDQTFAKMLVDEAKLASRIHHPNVVAVLDIERDNRASESTDLRLVMEYVEGASLSDLLQAAESKPGALPAGVVVRIVLDACAGLQVAHELTDEQGGVLGIVHRDVSPHNILVGVDGLARLSDFGIAKETSKPGSTTTGSLKGKLAYMAPEYIGGGDIDARADVFALGVVLWEAIAQKKLFRGSNDLETLQRVATAIVPSLGEVSPAAAKAFDELLQVALARDPKERFSSARAFGNALEAEARSAGLLASHAEVAAVVRELAKDTLESRREQIKEVVRKLDAARTGASTADGPLRGSVDRAVALIEAEPTTPDAGAPGGVDATLGGSGISRPTEVPADSEIVVPRRSSGALKWFAAAGLGGAALAVGLLTFSGGAGRDKSAATPGDAATSAAVAERSPSAAPSAPVGAAPSASASASVKPGASSPSMTAPSSSSVRGPSSRPAGQGPRPPTGGPGETIAPNPYQR